MEPAMQDKGRHFPFGVVAWYGNNQYLWIGKIHNNMVLIKINIIGGVFPILHKNLSVCLEEDRIYQGYIHLTPMMEYMELPKI